MQIKQSLMVISGAEASLRFRVWIHLQQNGIDLP